MSRSFTLFTLNLGPTDRLPTHRGTERILTMITTNPTPQSHTLSLGPCVKGPGFVRTE